MNTKTETAGKTAKRCAQWRETKQNGRKVLHSPEGRNYYGTPAEVRETVVMPWERDMLAKSLHDSRRVSVCGKNRADGRREEAAEERRNAIKRASVRWHNGRAPLADISAELAIRVRASARYMGRTLSEYLEEVLAASVDATAELSQSEIGTYTLPYTKRERAALERLGESAEKYPCVTAWKEAVEQVGQFLKNTKTA